MRHRSAQVRIAGRCRRLADRLPLVRKRREEGQALVEFALVIPVLLIILFAIVQFGIMLNTYITVTDAARSGARQLALEQGNDDPCDPSVQVATNAGNSAKIGSTNVTIGFTSTTDVVSTSDFCAGTTPNGSTTATATTYTYSPTDANTSGAEVQGDTASMTINKPFALQFFGFKLMNINLSATASDAVE
jgi:Flp pilus assembly protein TadG